MKAAPALEGSTAGPARRHSPLRTLLAILLSLVFFFVLAEVTLRIYLASHIFYDVEMSRYAEQLKIESANPAIGHVHRPGGQAELMGVDVRINSDGLRDDEHPRERTGARRLIFLGDSLTFGWGVPQDETFAALLERRLGETRPTEVLNFGIGNYNTSQEVALFLDKGLAYHPDEVVVFYFINDAEPTPRMSRWWWLGKLRVATFYWSRVKALWAQLFPGKTYQEYYSGLYQDDQEGWAETKRAFLELAEVCRKNGIELRVVLLPELHRLDEYPFARQHQMVTHFLSEHGIQAIDLAPRFRAVADPQSLWVSRDDAHPNARAHRMIAEYSQAFLADAGARGESQDESRE